MRAELKRIHSPDLLDPESQGPDDPWSFCVLFQLMIGVEGEEGEESFDVVVLTPRWMLEHWGETKVLFGYHHLIVMEYNFQRIRQKFEKFIGRYRRDTWAELAQELRLIGQWEFEGYPEPSAPRE